MKKGKHHSEETRKKLSKANKGQIPWNKGKIGIYSEVTLQKMSEANKGRTPWKGKHHSEASKQKMSDAHKGKTNKFSMEHCLNLSKALKGKCGKTKEQRMKIAKALSGKHPSEETRRKMAKARIGIKSHFYIDGRSKVNATERELAMHSIEYKLWREKVFQRDDYTCQICGDATGRNLNADHIKPWKYFPELRYELSNGRTLCVSCHKKTDTWGRKAIKKLDIKLEI